MAATTEMILDVQSFIGPNHDFIPKEVSVIEVHYEDVPRLARLLFKPPCAWEALSKPCRSINRWLKRNYHGLDWNCGDIPHTDMSMAVNRIVQDADRVLVKGPEKKSWLESILNDRSKSVIDLTAFNCPGLGELRDVKVVGWFEDDHGHIPNYSCAFENVQRLRKWYVDNEAKLMGRCHQHYLSMSDDQFDGPLPFVKDCVLCQNNK